METQVRLGRLDREKEREKDGDSSKEENIKKIREEISQRYKTK